MDPSIGRNREGGNRVSIGVRRIDWLKEDFSARRQTVSLDEARRTLVAASLSLSRDYLRIVVGCMGSDGKLQRKTTKSRGFQSGSRVALSSWISSSFLSSRKTR